MARLVEPHLLPAGANMLRAVFHRTACAGGSSTGPKSAATCSIAPNANRGLDKRSAGAALLEELRGYGYSADRLIGAPGAAE